MSDLGDSYAEQVGRAREHGDILRRRADQAGHVVNERVDAFLREVAVVCQRHGLVLCADLRGVFLTVRELGDSAYAISTLLKSLDGTGSGAVPYVQYAEVHPRVEPPPRPSALPPVPRKAAEGEDDFWGDMLKGISNPGE